MQRSVIIPNPAWVTVHVNTMSTNNNHCCPPQAALRTTVHPVNILISCCVSRPPHVHTPPPLAVVTIHCVLRTTPPSLVTHLHTCYQQRVPINVITVTLASSANITNLLLLSLSIGESHHFLIYPHIKIISC